MNISLIIILGLFSLPSTIFAYNVGIPSTEINTFATSSTVFFGVGTTSVSCDSNSQRGFNLYTFTATQTDYVDHVNFFVHKPNDDHNTIVLRYYLATSSSFEKSGNSSCSYYFIHNSASGFDWDYITATSSPISLSDSVYPFYTISGNQYSFYVYGTSSLVSEINSESGGFYVDSITGYDPNPQFSTYSYFKDYPITNGYVTPSTTFTVSFPFYNNGYSQYAGVQLADVTSGRSILTTENTVLVTGFSSTTHTLTLTSGHGYSIRPYLRTNNTFVYGKTIIFSAVTSAYQSTVPNTTFFDEFVNSAYDAITNSSSTSASSTAGYCDRAVGSLGSNPLGYGVCTALAFLFIPSQDSLNQFSSIGDNIKNKPPFVYFYQAASLWDTSVGQSSGNFSELIFVMPTSTFEAQTGVSFMPHRYVLFSTSTVFAGIDQYYWDLLRSLMTTVIWVGVAGFAYREVTKQKAL